MKVIIKLVVVILVAASAVGIGVTVVNNVVDSPKKTIAKMEMDVEELWWRSGKSKKRK